MFQNKMGLWRYWKKLLGNNYFKECDEDSKLFKVCEDGYFPDENGGWAYINNCEISDHGKCIKYKDNFMINGENTYLTRIYFM